MLRPRKYKRRNKKPSMSAFTIDSENHHGGRRASAHEMLSPSGPMVIVVVDVAARGPSCRPKFPLPVQPVSVTIGGQAGERALRRRGAGICVGRAADRRDHSPGAPYLNPYGPGAG